MKDCAHNHCTKFVGNVFSGHKNNPIFHKSCSYVRPIQFASPTLFNFQLELF